MPKPTIEDRRAVLSIDLGASYTKVAWRPAWTANPARGRDEFTRPSVPLLIDEGHCIPSLVLDPGRGRAMQFGLEAEGTTPDSEGCLFRNWKSQLFDPDCSPEQLLRAQFAAKEFLGWLFKKAQAAIKSSEFNHCRLRICIPAFEPPVRVCGEENLRRAVETANWGHLPLVFESEPKANLIGFGTGGRNRCIITDRGEAEVLIGEMYSRPMLGATRLQHFNLKFGIIDIGAFTTDVSICSLNSVGNPHSNGNDQASFVHGVSSLDAQLRALAASQGVAVSSEREFRAIKEECYQGRDFSRAIGGKRIQIRAQQLVEGLEDFANTVVSKCAPLLEECRWFTLTGGGAVIPKIKEIVERALKQNGRRNFEHFAARRDDEVPDTRLATAIGGTSVVFDIGCRRESQVSEQVQPPAPPAGKLCTCAGRNKDCSLCGGAGWIDDVPEPVELPPPRPSPPQIVAPMLPVEPPARPVPPPIRPRRIQQPREEAPIDEATIVNIWDEARALDEFTLAGWMGRLVFGWMADADAQRRQLRDEAPSPEGKAAWLRLLCLGCCLGAGLSGHPTMKQRVGRFWTSDENLRPIWDDFLSPDLANAKSAAYQKVMDELFTKAIHRRFNNLDASGEDAELWRRFFYDFRKMHHFVYRNDFASAILEVADNPHARGVSLINFLKSGHLPGQAGRWLGVIGQSMKSPVFFLARELRRLNVIDDRFDEVAYYLNSPARTVATRLGWTNAVPWKAYSVEELTDFSRDCRDKQTMLREFYDLPLQWYALQNPR